MTRTISQLAALALAVPSLARAAEYQFDTLHTKAAFSVRHMMFNKVHGEFAGPVTGTVVYDEKNPASLKVEASIDTATISTNEPKRDTHLKSPDFFDAEKYPQLKFKSKKAEVQADKHIKLTGDLTMRGVTKEVVFGLEPIWTAKTPWGQMVLGTVATTSVNRQDYGISWNKTLDAGGVLVSDNVDIELNIEVIPKQAPEAGKPAEAAKKEEKAAKK